MLLHIQEMWMKLHSDCYILIILWRHQLRKELLSMLAGQE